MDIKEERRSRQKSELKLAQELGVEKSRLGGKKEELRKTRNKHPGGGVLQWERDAGGMRKSYLLRPKNAYRLNQKKAGEKDTLQKNKG